MTTNGSMTNETSPDDIGVMKLCLHISDIELCNELAGYKEGGERHDFAVSALKIGTIALRSAQSRIDADRVRQEGKRLIENMEYALAEHRSGVTEQINNCLRDYFDPKSGQFNQRVQSLIEQGGELERVIRSQVQGDGSILAQTLTAHVGKDSRLMRILDPESTSGLIIQLTQSMEAALAIQREQILSQFSLDNGESALSRLVAELKTNHGEVGKALQERIETVTSEFSLDKEDSALSRLVNQIERTQRQISKEFSLDEEGSALARMRKELLDVLETQKQTNAQFQTELTKVLAEMTARKQESERSTRHGIVFEDDVFDFINERGQISGDISTRTANTTGRISRNKKGDVVIELGREHSAAGSKIVVEAKQDASFTLDKALSELEEARKNRDAGIGLFVFSARTVPPGIASLKRYGYDVVVVWDTEDPASDVVFDAGLSLSKALCMRAKDHSDEVGADIEAIESAILEIQKQADSLDEIKTSAETIRNGSDKILNRARIMRETLAKQIDILNGKVGGLREVVGSTD